MNRTGNHARYMANLSKGKEFYKAQRFEDALKYFTTALELEPHSHRAWNEKGNALRRLGRQKEAIDCYEQAIHLDKKQSYPFPYIGVADLYREQEQYSGAIAYYDRAIRIKRHPWALNGKGMCLHALNQTDEALKLAEESIRIRPKFPFPYILKGDILYERAAYRDALSAYQKVLGLIRGASPELQEEIKRKIAQCPGSDSIVGSLFVLLQSERDQDRVHATYQLDVMAKGGGAGEIIHERPFDVLLDNLRDPIQEVRRNILWIVGNLALQGYSYEVAESGILSEMTLRLDDQVELVRSAAAWSFAMITEAGQGIGVADSGAPIRCILLLQDASSDVQACAALALDKIAFYASPEPVVRNGGVVALVNRLDVKDDGVRICVLWALWSIACRGYVDSLCDAETLITNLKRCALEKNLEVRKAAVSIIGELSNQQDKSFLQQKDLEKILLMCIGSKSNRVRGAAIWAAGLWVDAGYAPTLIQAGVKEAVESCLGDHTKVHVFNHSERRWKKRSIGGIADDVLKKIIAPPEPLPSDPAPCESDYRTAYFVAQNLANHLHQNDLLEARKCAIHLEGFVCGDILERVLRIREQLRFCADEAISAISGDFTDEMEMLKEDILREAMR